MLIDALMRPNISRSEFIPFPSTIMASDDTLTATEGSTEQEAILLSLKSQSKYILFQVGSRL